MSVRMVMSRWRLLLAVVLVVESAVVLLVAGVPPLAVLVVKVVSTAGLWASLVLRRRRAVDAWFGEAGEELASGEMAAAWRLAAARDAAPSTRDVVMAANAVWLVEQRVAELYRERPKAVRAMGPEEFARRLLAERDRVIARRELAEAFARAAGELFRLGVEVRRDVEGL